MQEIWSHVIALGIDKYTIIFILSLPVVATLVGIARHIIGLKTLSIYAPIVLTYAFIELSFDHHINAIRYIDGLRYGLFLFALVFITTTAIYKLTHNLRLHFYPKLSLIFTAVSIMMLLTVVSAAYLGSTGFINVNIFSLVLISAVAERIVAIYAKTNFRNTLFLSLETILLTLASYTLVSWPEFQTFLLNNPWILIVIVILNIFVGKFTGLRLREYWRFRQILDMDYTETNGDSKDTTK